MRPDDYTEIGGTAGNFMTTHWSLVEKAGSPEQDQDKAFIGLLLNRYWKPVYCYLRRKGYDNEQAKDLTQGFFHEVVLERRLIERVEEAKGRFRSFLLVALDRYLVNVYERETAQKRSPQGSIVSLEFAEIPVLPSSVAASTPEHCFNYAWFIEIVDRVLDLVEASCHEDGMVVHWQLFQDRVLEPIREAIPAPTIRQLSDRYHLSDTTKPRKMIYTVKRRLRSALQKLIRETVVSEGAIPEEWEEMRKFFPDFS